MDFTRNDVAHLLRRAGFGGKPGEIDALMGEADWAHVVDAVLDTSANPPDTIPPAVDVLGVGQYYQAWVAAVHFWMDRMATSPTPIVEKMALFWHGHFVSAEDKVLTRLLFRQVKMYRQYGLGDLHELAQRMAVDPAMLQYLDNATNVKGEPNENFARELMELFTLGNFQFAESDVIAMARAWTGHGLTRDAEGYRFYDEDHDHGNKTLFGIAPRDWDGPAALTEIVRGSKQGICARFIAGKLWSFLAYQAPAASLVDALTSAFITSNMNIKALLRAIFMRPEFRSATTRTALVRTPVEWMVATMRHLGMDAATLHPEWWLEHLGQRLFDPPNVSGWKQNAYWISTTTMWARGDWAGWVRWKANDAGFLAGAGDLTPAAATQAALDLFGINEPSPASRQVLEGYVAGEQVARRRWAVPPNLITLTMLSPDYQLS
jgi:uncharacterized protein (DUF1800 family)